MFLNYKYCLLPTAEQERCLTQYFGCCRFVYNLGLETKMRAWASARKNLTCIDLANQLKELKDTDAPWLKECPAQSLQMTLRNLDKSYIQFFKGGGFPKFKSKSSKQSIQFPQSVTVDFEKQTVSFPKLKAVACVFHRTFEGEIKTVTISKTKTGKYFVSILVDNQKENVTKQPVIHATTVGIDMGINAFCTLSDGSYFPNNRFLRNNLKKLRREQRKLARRFRKNAPTQSKGFHTQKLVVARLHETITNQRSDYLHKTSTSIIRAFDTICLEDLNIKGMLSNKRLSMAVSEVGWHTFKEMLQYKADLYGKNILYIGRFEPSSKTCSLCGNIFKELRLKDRFWTCISCGTLHQRDENAAKNIKNFGLRKKPSTVNASQ